MSESQLSEPSESTQSSHAWSIFGLLLSLGRPSSLHELTSICTSFINNTTTPQYIRVLCEIPDSPLNLTTDECVTASWIGCSAITRFQRELGPRFQVLKTFKRRKNIKPLNECNQIVKRRKLGFEEEEDNRKLAPFNVAECSSSTQTYLVHDNISKYSNITLNYPLDFCFLDKLWEERNSRVSMLFNSSTQTWKATACGNENTYMSVNGKHICLLDYTGSERTSYYPKVTKANGLLNLACLPEAIGHNTTVVGTEADEIVSSKIILRETQQRIMCSTQVSSEISTYEAVFKGKMVEERKGNPIVDNDKGEGHVDDIAVEETASDCLPNRNIEEAVTVRIRNVMPSLGKAKSKMPLHNQTTCADKLLPSDQKHLGKLQSKEKVNSSETLTSNHQTTCKRPEKNDVFKHCTEQNSKRENKSNFINQDICGDNNYHKKTKEKHRDIKSKPVHVSENIQLQEREYPKFESYTIEEEEGSGGYGTVYRARRKTDGLTFAIKYPHMKASKNHIQNEVKMLERFGGNNFIIKYVSSFKSGGLDCLVLQHVDHDRPEVLKREIDVIQLQWYGFCMFKSLAALHKQGIVHRDVKPGNFLFSRKAKKGYLIDFNLALDLHQKYGVSEKTKSSSNLTFFNHVPSATKSLLPALNKRSPSPGALGSMNHEEVKLQKPIPKNLIRKAGLVKDDVHAANGNIIKSQGADGSIITSIKDVTSNRSAERLREPIPCQGRKELLSLVQEARKGTNGEAVNGPTSKRKRVAATPGNGERNFVCVTPMPLHSTGVPIAGAGVLKSKGDIKQKREGSCVGTKGFRAPEVLVRSAHQGQKVDVWSAGVTLLYFMIGRAPFSGDPEQNIKEIAKLRGSEDLWEVAKLHNQESAFPLDLFDIKVSRPSKLLDWCKLNTRRPLEIFPESLFDLVDKCLTVNPRLRISAEEALGHAFFAPCQDLVRRYRMQKQGCNVESGIN